MLFTECLIRVLVLGQEQGNITGDIAIEAVMMQGMKPGELRTYCTNSLNMCGGRRVSV